MQLSFATSLFLCLSWTFAAVDQHSSKHLQQRDIELKTRSLEKLGLTQNDCERSKLRSQIRKIKRDGHPDHLARLPKPGALTDAQWATEKERLATEALNADGYLLVAWRKCGFRDEELPKAVTHSEQEPSRPGPSRTNSHQKQYQQESHSSYTAGRRPPSSYQFGGAQPQPGPFRPGSRRNSFSGDWQDISDPERQSSRRGSGHRKPTTHSREHQQRYQYGAGGRTRVERSPSPIRPKPGGASSVRPEFRGRKSHTRVRFPNHQPHSVSASSSGYSSPVEFEEIRPKYEEIRPKYEEIRPKFETIRPRRRPGQDRSQFAQPPRRDTPQRSSSRIRCDNSRDRNGEMTVQVKLYCNIM